MNAARSLERAGDVPGIAVFRDPTGRVRFVWLSASLGADAGRFAGNAAGAAGDLVTAAPAVEVLTEFDGARDLVDRFRALLAGHRPPGNLCIDGEPSYPYVKVTAGERFSRALVTRRVRDDGATYFGPFLPDTAVRRLVDVIRRLFRLRTCMIAVDGSWEAPCSEHGVGRCLAPCVRSICDSSRYALAVEDVRMLLSGNAFELAERLDARMAEASAAFAFEEAARWRDIRSALSDLAGDLRVRPDLASVTDLLVIRCTDDGRLAAALMTLDGGHVIGRRTFVRLLDGLVLGDSVEWTTAQVLSQLHDAYVPARVALDIDTPRVRLVLRAAEERSGRAVDVVRETGDARPVRLRLAEREATRLLVERVAADRASDPGDALDGLAAALGLPSPPGRIEAFDVAHLAGQTMTAAFVVAEAGRRRDGEDVAWIVDAGVEVEALERAVLDRFSLAQSPLPDLVVLVGGAGQLAAVARALDGAGLGHVRAIAVARPPGKKRGGAVVHGPDPAGSVPRRLDVPDGSQALRLLVRLREDASHAAAGAHRHHREFVQFARRPDRPGVVPARVDDPAGDAADLRPTLSLDSAERARLAKRQSPGSSARRPRSRS